MSGDMDDVISMLSHNSHLLSLRNAEILQLQTTVDDLTRKLTASDREAHEARQENIALWGQNRLLVNRTLELEREVDILQSVCPLRFLPAEEDSIRQLVCSDEEANRNGILLSFRVLRPLQIHGVAPSEELLVDTHHRVRTSMLESHELFLKWVYDTSMLQHTLQESFDVCKELEGELIKTAKRAAEGECYQRGLEMVKKKSRCPAGRRCWSKRDDVLMYEVNY
eukprot:PhF_6_TR18653/c0_g1_i1/m.27267